jgi:hypothetical protein
MGRIINACNTITEVPPPTQGHYPVSEVNDHIAIIHKGRRLRRAKVKI